MVKLFIFFSILILPLTANSQKTPEELGEYLLNHFKTGSLNKIDSLIPTLEEMKLLAEKLGIKKDSKQYLEAISGYPSELEKFHENIQSIYLDNFDNQLDWGKTVFQKVVSISDSLKLDNSDPDSKKVIVTRLSIYFTCDLHKFRIGIDDAFELNNSWKLGNNIYVKKID